MSKRSMTAALAVVGVMVAATFAACGDAGDNASHAGKAAWNTAHYETSELQANLPGISEFSGPWTAQDPRAEDVSGPAQQLSPCTRPSSSGITHSAKTYATNSVGSNSELKVGLLDFASAAAAQAYMRVIANVAPCAAKAPFKAVKLTGDCDRTVANSVHVNGEDGGAGAFMVCQHANLVAGLGVFENKQIHKGPFEVSELQAYFDVLTRHLDALHASGRATP
jgi:hypothetical protein